MALSDLKVKNAKPKEQRYRLADGSGLYLDVRPDGAKTWLFRYAADDGKRHWKTIGRYPVFSLAEARVKAVEMHRMKAGLAPSVLASRGNISFEAVAREFMPRYEQGVVSAKEKNNTLRRLEMHVFPFIGAKRIGEVTVSDIFGIAERLQATDKFETASRVVQICGRVFKYAMLKEYCAADPCSALRGELRKVGAAQTKHFAAITDPAAVGALMRNISNYPYIVVRLAMLYSAYTFCRPGEIRHAEWSEVDEAAATWTIRAEKMKASRDHIVPLSRQALEVLSQLRPLTGDGVYIFPNARAMTKGDRPMSENAVLVALRSMGYDNTQMTAHGFRSMASTILNENKFNRDWIEMQLAHAPRDRVRSAYNRAEYLEERREMMSWYADHLDALRDGKI